MNRRFTSSWRASSASSGEATFGKFGGCALQRRFEQSLHRFQADGIGVLHLSGNQAHAIDEVVVHHVEEQKVLAFFDERIDELRAAA